MKKIFLLILLFFTINVYATPSNSYFIDDNLYKCVIDSYNKNAESKKEYSYSLDDYELESIIDLNCENYKGQIEDLSGLNKLVNLESINLSGNTFIGGSSRIKLNENGKLNSLINLPNSLELTNFSYDYSNKGIIQIDNGIVKALKEGSTYVTRTSNLTGYSITEKFLVVVYTDVKKSTNAQLKSLEINSIDIGFDKDKYSYTLYVPNKLDEVIINAVTDDSKAKLLDDYTNKKASLKVGLNTFYINVKAESGLTKMYTVSITRSDGNDSNNNLSDISIPSIKLDFDPDVNIYSFTVDNTVSYLDINAISESLMANVTISSTHLEVGVNNIIITVTAENGDKKDYTLIVTREGDENDFNYLRDLKIEGYKIDFVKDKYEYTVRIKDSKSLNVTAVPEYSNANVDIDGNENLGNKSKIIIKVSNNNIIRQYTINIKKSILYNKELVLISEFGIIAILLVIIMIKSIKKKSKGKKVRKKINKNKTVKNKNKNSKDVKKDNIVCPNCSSINSSSSNTCYICGKILK